MVRTQHPVTLDGYSEPQPDVAVAVPRADGYYGSPSGGHYASVADVDADKPFALAALPTVEIDLSRLFAGLPAGE
jgi:hypothetical protein